MIKCVKGKAEIQGFPWTVMAEMVVIVRTVIKEYGNDAFEQILRLAMATDDDIEKMAEKAKGCMEPKDRKMLAFCDLLERMAMKDD